MLLNTMIMLFCVITLLTSCGKIKHEIRGVPSNYKIDAPHDFSLGPDFEKAAKVCNSFYGKKTAEAEACFKDYRNYTKLKIAIDLDSIKLFCKESYNVEEEYKSCISDLVTLINSLLGGKNG